MSTSSHICWRTDWEKNTKCQDAPQILIGTLMLLSLKGRVSSEIWTCPSASVLKINTKSPNPASIFVACNAIRRKYVRYKTENEFIYYFIESIILRSTLVMIWHHENESPLPSSSQRTSPRILQTTKSISSWENLWFQQSGSLQNTWPVPLKTTNVVRSKGSVEINTA